ncbi:RdgB/HAM1 family non-canonical purine NTP pyrophosphatase [Acholeplasma vituli]|uniref:dITP/XTP pyrophosphatase n=1 Tax=Paracholeplasma vituli TaxID=69473 RepID=A0ABT2PWU1_9MOLU|nr:RdgB/HAM1 family non-canonical purine NTP pyrophosphatase [Paracholeplasma vituli]MCU0105420.1 RdgB/HAM1 family non-canonical purine NTP pyrophosphatase [Paracholeplasma vituli]
MKLLVATQNKHKKEEIEAILNPSFEVVTLSDLNDFDEVEETGDSFFENALLKASYYAKKHQMLTLADDSGLCIDALNGEPGIYSARYSGGSDQENIQLVLDKLRDTQDRGAHFTCVLVLYDPSTNAHQSFQGDLYGIIESKPKGSNGFGYDPIFFVPEYKQTLAEMHSKHKNLISHRAIALQALKEALI